MKAIDKRKIRQQNEDNKKKERIQILMKIISPLKKNKKQRT